MPSQDLPDPLTDAGQETRVDAVPEPDGTEPDQPGAGEPVSSPAAEPQAVPPGKQSTTPTAGPAGGKSAAPPAGPAPGKQSAAQPARPAGGKSAAPPAGPAKNRKMLLAWGVAVIVIGLVVYLISSVAASTPPEAASPTPAGTSAAPATPAPSASVPATGNLSAVKVSGTSKPSITAPVPFAVAKTSKRLLTTGKGKAVSAGQRVTINYLGVNGTNGKTFDTSFGRPDPVTFILGDKNLIKGMVTGLTGVNVGSRVLLAIPAVDGYGANGAPDAGIGPTDTLLFLIDVKAAVTPPTPLTRATGAAVAPKAGLPTVTLDSGTGKPAITVPKSASPTSLVVQPLINGKGATVAKGQTITVHYTGVIWAGGKEFDSSWTKGTPASFAIGTGNVIPGWDKGLVGKKVGSQVLLVIPPAEGYGTAGAPDAGIKGTDTLVFVVDILAAA